VGLEKHVDEVLKKAGLIEHLWLWYDGLIINDPDEADFIIKVLDESGQFGPARSNRRTAHQDRHTPETFIEFGVHRDHYKDMFPDEESYLEYCDSFKAGGPKVPNMSTLSMKPEDELPKEMTFKIACKNCGRSTLNNQVTAYVEYNEQFGETIIFECRGCGNKWVNHYPLKGGSYA